MLLQNITRLAWCNTNNYFRAFSTNQVQQQLIKLSNENGVLSLTLTNTKKRNVLSFATLTELGEALEVAENDKNVRCVVISAEGNVFSSGHDLKELRAECGSEKHLELFQKCTSVMTKIRNLSVPVIAKVDGLAAAAGCQLVATCDIAACTPQSTFSLPGAAFGLFCSTPGIPVARNIPTKTTAFMLLTGQPINAQQALTWGLVTHVAEKPQLETAIESIIDSIRVKSRPVLALGKKFFYEQIELPTIQAAYERGEQIMVENLRYKDGKEGMEAFAEKRKPKWTHEV